MGNKKETTKLRTFYRLSMTTDTARKIDARKIKKGDIFRIVEPNGDAVLGFGTGGLWFIAYENAKKVKVANGYAVIPCFTLGNRAIEEKVKGAI